MAEKSRFCHANALAQQWFLTTEWQGLRGVTLSGWSEEKGLTAQMAVAGMVTKALSRCEIQAKGDTPKLGRCSINLEVFREMAGTVCPAMQYFDRLQMLYQQAWWAVPEAKKVGTQVDCRRGARSAKHLLGCF